MPFEFLPTAELPDVILVEPKAFGDARGWLIESYKRSDFANAGVALPFVQDVHSRTESKGTLRGLHYQLAPHAQGKLVRVLAGEVLDVAVDLRRASPTYRRWTSATLSAANRRALWIPPGFAHGFCTMTDGVEVLYKMTAEYSAPHDRAVRWNDPALGVRWPVDKPLLAPKDAAAPLLADAEH